MTEKRNGEELLKTLKGLLEKFVLVKSATGEEGNEQGYRGRWIMCKQRNHDRRVVF
jgi:hypothetical protein